MQADDYNYQPDEQFTDMAWGEMHKMLDKEMPVKKKKRRGFFWLFFLVGLGIIASGWWVMMDKSSNGTTSSSASSIEISTKEKQKQNLADFSKEDDKINEKTETTILTKPEIKIDSNQKVNKTKIGNSTEVKKQITPVDNYFNNSPPIPLEENPSLQKGGKEEIIFPLEKLDIETEISEPVVLFLNTEIIDAPFSLLLEKDFPLFGMNEDLMNYEYEEEKIIKEPTSKDRKIELGIYAGILLDFANLHEVGAFTGLNVHIPIKEKLGIRTGLGVAALPKSLEYQFIGEQEADVRSDVDLTSIPSNIESIPIQSRTDFILETMFRVELPILFTYMPHKKIQLHLGASGSYFLDDILSSQVNELALAPEFASNQFGVGLDYADLNSVSKNQYQEEDYWNRWDISGIAGFTWKPFKRWQIELQYHHGFLDILSTNSDGILSSSRGSRGAYEVYENSTLPLTSITGAESFQRNSLNRNRSLRLSIGYNF